MRPRSATQPSGICSQKVATRKTTVADTATPGLTPLRREVLEHEGVFRLPLDREHGGVTGRGTAEEIYPQILADTVTGCNMLEVDGTC